MKNYICLSFFTLGLLFTRTVGAQIEFIGDSEGISTINTLNGENYLVLSPRGKRIAFTKERQRGSSPQEPDYVDQFFEVFDSTWQATVYSAWTDGTGMFSPVGFDKAGNQYFSKVSFHQGVYAGKVFRSLNDGGVVEVAIPFLENKSPHQSGCLSKDGRYMILSMESPNTYGVEDLYLVQMRQGHWTSPINLGRQVNTKFQEITPFLARDNKTLFFATNGRKGEGSFDIYYSVRLDDSWRKWSKPKNVGVPVNTSGAETSFSFLEGDDWAYFVSSQSSDGYGDVRRIKINMDIEEDSTGLEEDVVASERPAHVVLKIVDKKTRASIPSEMISVATTLFSANGLFTIDSLSDEEVAIKSQGYLPRIVILDSSLEVGENEIGLESIAVGTTITLSHVLFAKGTSKMVEGSAKELNLVVEMMNDNPDVKILLKGHTDNRGDPVLNVRRVKFLKIV